ncbi:MAG: 3-oxoacyl-[acyl-carrier-protein] synthase III C-terminal domain-containing protein, partial [Candidatus Omnitrophota bacterium]
FYMSPDQKMFFKIMDNELVPFAKNIFRNARVDINDIDLFLLHYPSRPLYDNFMKGLNIPRQKIFNTFPEHGNVIASEMPILLERAINSRRIHSGDLIFMFTYGAGITGGGLIMRY